MQNFHCRTIKGFRSLVIVLVMLSWFSILYVLSLINLNNAQITDKFTLSELMSWVPSLEELLRFNGSQAGCVTQSLQLLRDAEDLHLQSLHILDSSAKFPPGVLLGNVNQLGDFDQCVGAGGRYCLATLDLRLPKSLTGLDSLIHGHNPMTSTVHDPGHRIPKMSLVHWGICLPVACSAHDLQGALVNVLYNRGLDVPVRVDPDMCHATTDPTIVPSSFTIFAKFLILLVFLLCVFGTVLDFLSKKITNDLGKLSTGLHSFCVRCNVKTLLNTDSSKTEISSLHGIRALNAVALLLSHKQMALLFLPFVNRTYLAQLIGRAWSMTGRAAILYTDSFILLSGLLTALSLLRELTNIKKINIAESFLNRIIRLTPSLAALIFFCTLILPSLGSGPLWGLLVNKYAGLCQQHWWRNLLYIHNHFPFHEMCLTHSHQVGIDMQLFLAAPLLVYPLWRWPRAGIAWLLVVAVWSSVLRYTVALSQHLTTVVYFHVPISQLFRTAEKTYILPSHRATVYCVGIALGYFIHVRRTWDLSKAQVMVGWMAGAACGLLAMFGPYHMSWMSYVYSPQEAALYNMWAPVLWSLFISWLVFASHYGYAGWFGQLLSWRWFAVFTRLSYAIYLTQFPIFFYNVGQARISHEYSILKLLDLSEFTCVLGASILLTLMFDMPAQNLKKALFPSKAKEIMLLNQENEAKSITKLYKKEVEHQRKRTPG